MSGALLFAQGFAGTNWVHWAIVFVLVVAIVSLIKLYCDYAQVTIHPLLIKAFWVVLGAVVIIGAIIFLARFAGIG